MSDMIFDKQMINTSFFYVIGRSIESSLNMFTCNVRKMQSATMNTIGIT